ncbi:OsmC family protein [Niveibacterium sp. SC-1]|uniref:OsmC family protein n=1 Tax=Niveibacterium sp. SC-1 TaxID=3135646 RepID=UPI00311DAF59
MAHHSARITWHRDPATGSFTRGQYSRAHTWQFDGGVSVPASSSPGVVPLPWSDERAVDPEEAFVASLSSCHMLWFLSLAADQGFTVDAYDDAAEGVMAKNAAGKLVISEVFLRPQVRFSGTPPTPDQHATLHHAAHEACFIANSVLTTIHCDATIA